MKEAPKNITETVVQERKSSIPETAPDYKGGMTDEEATRVEQEFAARQAKDQQAASATMETMTARMPETAPEKDVKVKSLKDKIMGFFGQAPEQLASKYSKLGEERMKKNSTLRQAYKKYLSTEGEKVAQAYKEAIGKWPYIARDEKGNFVDRTIYSSGTGDVPGDKERGN
jgi:hypothetical protein